ncbi:MAG: 3TM-type holin [Paracoccaceae bacterium]
MWQQLSTLINPVSNILDKFIEDKDQKAALAHEIATMAERHGHEIALAQIEVLKADAAGNWFQSSWRPLIGWICGLSLGINYMVSPILAGFGIEIPQADMSVMMPLLFGMLGIAGMRSYDKQQKTDTKG